MLHDIEVLIVNCNFLKDWFDINSANGYLYTKTAIDREIAETISLVIGVEDLNATSETSPQISTSND